MRTIAHIAGHLLTLQRAKDMISRGRALNAEGNIMLGRANRMLELRGMSWSYRSRALAMQREGQRKIDEGIILIRRGKAILYHG